MKPGTHQPAMTGAHRAPRQSSPFDPLRVLGLLLMAGTALGTIVVLCRAAVALLALAEVGR